MAATVLVSGGGGAAAISTIKALRMGGFDGRIVATDAERLSAGLYLADAFRVVPRAKDPAFFPAVQRLIEDEHIGVIFPKCTKCCALSDRVWDQLPQIKL